MVPTPPEANFSHVELLIVTIYGYANGNPELGIVSGIDSIMPDVIPFIQQWPRQKPIIVGGDFNTEISEFGQMQEIDEGHTFVDVAQVFDKTEATSLSSDRRIDQIWANNAAVPLISGLEISTNIVKSGHKMLTLNLNIENSKLTSPTRKVPKELPAPKTDRQGVEELDYEPADLFHAQQWSRAIQAARNPESTDEQRQEAMDNLFQIWSTRCEKTAYIAAGKTWTRQCSERGKEMPLKHVPRAYRKFKYSPPMPESKAVSKNIRNLNKMTLLLVTAGRTEIRNGRFHNLWNNIFKLQSRTSPYKQNPIVPLLPPTPECIMELAKKTESERLRQCEEREFEQLKNWQDDMHKNAAFKRIRKPAAIIKPYGKVGNEITTCPDRLIEAKIEEWSKIWDPSDQNNPAIERLIRSAMGQQQEIECPPITPVDIQMILSEMKIDKAPGACGWTPRDIKVALKRSQRCEELALIFNLMEEVQCLPQPFNCIDIVLIPKGESEEDGERPVSLTSVCWRLYSSIRLKFTMMPAIDALLEQEGLSDWLKGCRRQCSTKDLTMLSQIDHEYFDLLEQSVCTISFDIRKCFDTIDFKQADNDQEQDGVAWEILRHLGWPRPVERAMRALYKKNKKRFRRGRHLGRSFSSKSGALQGCSLSMAAENFLTIIWSSLVKYGLREEDITEEVRQEAIANNICTAATWQQFKGRITRPCHPTTSGGGYLDDVAARAIEQIEIRRVAELSMLWVTGVRQRFHPGKCFTTGCQTQLFGQRLAKKSYGVVLGELTGNAKKVERVMSKRIKAMEQGAAAVRNLPGDKNRKADLLSKAVTPRGYPGVGQILESREVSDLRRKYWKAIAPVGTASYTLNLRCMQVVFAVFFKAHVLDPVGSHVYKSMLDYCLFVAKLPEEHICLDKLQHILANCEESLKPYAHFFKFNADLGVTWESVRKIMVNGQPFDLSTMAEKENRSEFGSVYRKLVIMGMIMEVLNEQRKSGNKVLGVRQEMIGIQNINCKTTRYFYEKSNNKFDQGMIIFIVSGALWTRKRRLEHLKKGKDANCQMCKARGIDVLETKEHLLWQCPYFQENRCAEMDTLYEQRNDLQPCTVACGIFVNDQVTVEAAKKIHQSMATISRVYYDNRLYESDEEDDEDDDEDLDPSPGNDDDDEGEECKFHPEVDTIDLFVKRKPEKLQSLMFRTDKKQLTQQIEKLTKKHEQPLCTGNFGNGENTFDPIGCRQCGWFTPLIFKRPMPETNHVAESHGMVCRNTPVLTCTECKPVKEVQPLEDFLRNLADKIDTVEKEHGEKYVRHCWQIYGEKDGNQCAICRHCAIWIPKGVYTQIPKHEDDLQKAYRINERTVQAIMHCRTDYIPSQLRAFQYMKLKNSTKLLKPMIEAWQLYNRARISKENYIQYEKHVATFITGKEVCVNPKPFPRPDIENRFAMPIKRELQVMRSLFSAKCPCCGMKRPKSKEWQGKGGTYGTIADWLIEHNNSGECSRNKELGVSDFDLELRRKHPKNVSQLKDYSALDDKELQEQLLANASLKKAIVIWKDFKKVLKEYKKSFKTKVVKPWEDKTNRIIESMTKNLTLRTRMQDIGVQVRHGGKTFVEEEDNKMPQEMKDFIAKNSPISKNKRNALWHQYTRFVKLVNCEKDLDAWLLVMKTSIKRKGDIRSTLNSIKDFQKILKAKDGYRDRAPYLAKMQEVISKIEEITEFEEADSDPLHKLFTINTPGKAAIPQKWKACKILLVMDDKELQKTINSRPPKMNERVKGNIDQLIQYIDKQMEPDKFTDGRYRVSILLKRIKQSIQDRKTMVRNKKKPKDTQANEGGSPKKASAKPINNQEEASIKAAERFFNARKSKNCKMKSKWTAFRSIQRMSESELETWIRTEHKNIIAENINGAKFLMNKLPRQGEFELARSVIQKYHKELSKKNVAKNKKKKKQQKLVPKGRPTKLN